ncbi:hypothetical protein [Nafulsella turpanensis]|uniref:hypothetical protein n=1 Tax=Nafulsella turpanensis TaxID=1265690 RepID=UPI0003457620|nr:hypothetical protein [Nafulsella turpanensis]
MRHLIFYEVQTAAICPYRLLFFDKFFDPLSETDPFVYSNIYLFTRVKKNRFDLGKTRLINKRTLKTTIILGGKEYYDLTISFFDTIPMFKMLFKTRENFEDLLSDDDDYWKCEIDSENSSSDKIHFFLHAKTGNAIDFWLIPENIEMAINIENQLGFKNKPEVVYVGQSFQMSKRIKSHKTLHKAVSQLKDGEEIRLYFLTFKYGYGGHKDYFQMEGQVMDTWLSEFGMSKEFKSKISLVERFLIHFLKPIYNEQHVNSNIMNDSLVKTILTDNNIDVITLDFGVWGKSFEFWSPNQQLKTDCASFNFLKPDLGYQEGFVANEIE